MIDSASSHDTSVVITGASTWCSLGNDRGRILEAMLADEVRIDDAPAIEGRIEPVEGEPLRPVRAAQAVDLDGVDHRSGDRAERYLRAGIARALEEAGIRPEAWGDRRIETIFGTTLGGMRHVGRALRTDRTEDYVGSVTSVVNRSALEGTGLPAGGTTISAACASGVSAVALAGTALLLGEADLAIAIAYDPISEFAFAGFSCLRLVAQGPLRPFTAGREGMRVGEGYGVFVLEREDDARARGGKPLARVRGWGAASDAHHLTQPVPDGRGAARAFRDAMTDRPDVVVAHATSTPANDVAEHAAMHALFGEELSSVPVTALKSRIGHTLGAAGAVELGVLLAMMERGIVPSTANAAVDRDAFPTLDLVTEPREIPVNRGVVVSLGFGGADAAIEVESPRLAEPVDPRSPIGAGDQVVVTGWGVLVPGLDGAPIRPGEIGLSPDALDELDDARAVRRLARFARLVRAAGRLATEHAGLDADRLVRASAFVGTRFGAAEYTLDYYEELLRDGLGAGNPLFFAESVPNIGSAQLSLGLGIQGSTLSTSGSRLAGVEALHLARRHLASGQSEAALVVAAEETHPRVRRLLERLRRLDDRPMAEGAVAVLLERRSAAEARGARCRAVLASTGLEWPTHVGWRGDVAAWEAAASAAIPPVLACGADAGDSRPGDRLAARARSAIRPDWREEAVERQSVGPLLTLIDAIRTDGRGTVLARDEAGGAARATIESV